MVEGAGHDVPGGVSAVAVFDAEEVFGEGLEEALACGAGGEAAFGAVVAESRALAASDDEGGDFAGADGSRPDSRVRRSRSRAVPCRRERRWRGGGEGSRPGGAGGGRGFVEHVVPFSRATARLEVK